MKLTAERQFLNCPKKKDEKISSIFIINMERKQSNDNAILQSLESKIFVQKSPRLFFNLSFFQPAIALKASRSMQKTLEKSSSVK